MTRSFAFIMENITSIWYDDILMLYDMLNTYEWISAIINTSNVLVPNH